MPNTRDLDHARVGARRAWLLVCASLATAWPGCGSPGSAGPSPASASLGAATPSATADLPRWLVGRWVGDGGDETWTDFGHALIGVGLGAGRAAGSFEVMMIAERDGALMCTAMPGGGAPVDFTAVADPAADRDAAEGGGDAIAFVNPAHDDPRAIHYRRRGDALEARALSASGAGPRFAWRRAPLVPSPALAARDRAFAADSAARGGPAWTAAFAPNAALWTRRGGRIQGNHAIGLVMSRVLDGGDLRLAWEPIASGVSRAADLGFTVGRYRLIRHDGDVDLSLADVGAYVTIWRRDATGWIAIFDAGVPEPP